MASSWLAPWPHTGATRAAVALASAALLAGCAGSPWREDASSAGASKATPAVVASPAASAVRVAAGPLAETEWRLLEIQSMDDTVGTTRPEDPSLYTLRLHADGTVDMRLDCNRANGSWTAEPSADPTNGRFAFGPLAMTRASCPPPSLDRRIAAQAPYVRGYMLKDGRLALSLMADGGTWLWEPSTDTPREPEGDR